MTELPLFPDEESLVVGLVERGLPEWGALVVAPQIAALRSPLRESFLSWWQTGDVPDVSGQEQSVRSLVASGFHPLAALLSLDALDRNSAMAKEHLRWGQERFVPVVDNMLFNSSGESQ